MAAVFIGKFWGCNGLNRHPKRLIEQAKNILDEYITAKR